MVTIEASKHVGRTGAGVALASLSCILASLAALAQPAPTPPPARLQDTGLYADAATLEVDSRHLAFAPQYPLWTDGAAKRRWISLPPGTAVDASDPDNWVFPVGTRLWKEFSFDGRRIETRYLERLPDGQWSYAAYAWSADGRSAQLVPAGGKPGAYRFANGRFHDIPGREDCKACHQGGRSEVLGFSALQLSPSRDLNAVHSEPPPGPGVDLAFLVREGLLRDLPPGLLKHPPAIQAKSDTERAALGYLHGNCGHCHNGQGPLRNLGLVLRHGMGSAVEPALSTTVAEPVRKPAPGQTPDARLRVEPGRPDRSVLLQRVRSRYSALQMPPLGTELVDERAVQLLYRWIEEHDGPRVAATLEGNGGER